jgi:putative Holliday junction resolvase
VLGIDPGTVRVGLAVSDETRTLASPLASMQRNSAALWERIAKEIAVHNVRHVVVGLPRRLDGSEGDAAADARALARDVEAHTRLPVTLWDERFTTVQAQRHLISAGMRRRRRRDVVDAAAAALLLQGWLDAQPAAV